MAKVILNTVDSVIYEGSLSNCELVMSAFKIYNNCHNIVLEGGETFLDEGIKKKVVRKLAEIYTECANDSGYLSDAIYTYEMYSDEELVDELETFKDSDEESDLQDLIAEALANKAVDNMLNSEEL